MDYPWDLPKKHVLERLKIVSETIITDMECAYASCKRPITQPRLCPGCKKFSYCSQQCRLEDWYAGHQLACGSQPPESEGRFKLSEFKDEEQKTRVLGKGSYGEVRLVVHVPTKEKYAMKVVRDMQINKAQFQRENNLQIMKREITLQRNLDHPHIIKLIDNLEDSENVYLILEYANRGSLFFEVRRQKKLTEEKARVYFRQTCEGVQYLHEHDIIHRDIKPENLLLDGTGSIKICDFGWCAKGTETRTTFCGTLDYMSPEMVMGAGHTFAVDIWALGVLVYELTHGHAPFTARKESEKCQQIMGLTYTIDPSISPELKDLISRILKTAPEERLTIAQILAHPWLQGSPKNEELSQGAILKNYVKGYGMAEGVVTSVNGDQCTVFYAVPNVTETLQVSRVARILKRKFTMQKSELTSPDVKEIEPTAFPTAQDGIQPIEETVLLDKIDQWCKVPSKVPLKKNKFLQDLEETNKKLERSLSMLNQKAKPKSGEKTDLEGNPNADLTKKEKSIVPQEKPSEESKEIVEESEELDDQSDFAVVSEAKIAEISANHKLAKSQDFSKTEHVLQEPNGYGLFLPKSDSLLEDLEHLSLPKQDESESLYGKMQEEQPVLTQLENKSLRTESSVPEERETAGFSPMGSTHEVPGRLLDFEYERQLIEEKNQLFYSQTEEKWANRGSKESVVHAPILSTADQPGSRGALSLIQEVEELRNLTKRGPEDPAIRLSELGKANAALQLRKQQLESFLKEIDAPPALPRVRKPVSLPPQSEGKGGFLRWIGSVIGCGDRN